MEFIGDFRLINTFRSFELYNLVNNSNGLAAIASALNG